MLAIADFLEARGEAPGRDYSALTITRGHFERAMALVREHAAAGEGWREAGR